MKLRILPFLIPAVLVSAAYGQKKPGKKNPPENNPTPVTVTPAKEPNWAPKAKLYPYQPSREQEFDLLDTRLDVRFDWAKTWLLGKANLKLKPWCYPQGELELDAKGFEIHKVAVVKNGSQSDLKYTYNGKKLLITLDRTYKADETVEIFIDYTAKPNDLTAGGSAAIQGAKGLYFINPDKSDPSKPQQIWTQGETEASSCWFPTIDAPNERTTEEVAMTVDKNFVTLCNGVMVSTRDNGDGTRTDVWKHSLPHAPYLFMMAVGEFAVVKDTPWRGREVSYYVEPEYEPYAKLIFGNTPEMLEFFSNRMGVEYPWEKFSQVVVRDFVSGAMENTSAVVHFTPVQHNAREHLDNTYESIISHELFHHWFGDLVTCESWSNVPLNESFATYGEYLWDEHKYGLDEAAYTLTGFLSGYLGESQVKREQLIRYQYEDKEDMFDGHSYSKGGRVLHMLRNEVGDDAFFASLKLYLTRNAYTSVEIHDLRLAFEDVTGRDLNWFFNQYFLSPGHPEIAVEYTWDEGSKSVKASVKQTQDLRYMPVYNLPVIFETYTAGKKARHAFRMSTTDTVYVFSTGAQPDYTTFDPDKMLLARISEKKPKNEWVAQLKYGTGFMLRDQALKQLNGSMSDEAVVITVLTAASDTFWATRRAAFNQLDLYSGTNLRPQIRKAAAQAALNDESALVRSAALDVLTSSSAEINDPVASKEIVDVLEKAMEDSSYSVQGRAWKAMVKYRKEETLSRVRSMGEVKDPKTSQMIAGVLMTAKAPEAVTFISSQIQRWPNGYGKYGSLVDLGEFLSGVDEATRTSGIKLLMSEGAGNPTTLIRLGALRGLSGFTEREDVKQFIAERKLVEKSDRVLKYLSSMN